MADRKTQLRYPGGDAANSIFSHDQVIIRQPDGSHNAYYVPREVAEYIHYLHNVMDKISYEIEKEWWDD